MSNSVITIGVTTYNAANTVDEAIGSALEQSWHPIEIVVIDDCSTDDTWNILSDYALKCVQVRVFRNKFNRGVAYSRNRVIEEASGEFVVFFDDDDVSKPDRLQKQYERITLYEYDYAKGHPVICHVARKVFYPSGEIRIELPMGITTNQVAPHGIAVARRVLLGEPMRDGYGACPTCSQMARVATYRQLDGFDESFRRSEDTEFNIRLAKASGHFVGIAEPLVTQSMTLTSEKSLADEHQYMMRLLEKHRDVADADGLYEFCCRWLQVKQDWMQGRRMVFLGRIFMLMLCHPVVTLRRLMTAIRNIPLNNAFKRFHSTNAT